MLTAEGEVNETHSSYISDVSCFGKVYSFGFGGDGCLALGDTEDRITPRLVEALSGKPVMSPCVSTSLVLSNFEGLFFFFFAQVESICAGRRAMFVILKATGAIWSSGQSPANGDTTGLRLV